VLRFDDLCPTLDWEQWEPLEAILKKLDIKPLIGVVPDNRDPALCKGRKAEDFWDRVRGWQAMGWAIGIHGYQHKYETRSTGIVGIRRYSEFAGLPRAQQAAKLKKGLAIFQQQGITADAWIAPSHSFDEITVDILRMLGITTISDGYTVYPYRDRGGTLWVPQQIGTFRRMPFGLWTICCHLGDPPCTNPRLFEKNADRLRRFMITLDEVTDLYPCGRPAIWETFSAATLLSLRRIKAGFSDIRARW
jgi:predicted deacetylase